MATTLQTRTTEQGGKLNPANQPEKHREPSTRIPMSVPTLRLAVPEIPGYYCHWFLGPIRVQRALKAGYEFVESDEVSTTNFDLAGNLSDNGSTDLGSRLSVVGGTDEKGAPERLYLMKLKNEYREEDVEANIRRNEKLAQAINAGAATGERPEHSYIKDAPNIFTRKN